jgi:hypothetical protein
MNLIIARRMVIALILVGAVGLVLPLPAAVRVPFGLLQAYYLPGLVFLLFLGSSKRSLLDVVFIPPLISPVIISLLVVAVEAVTGVLETSITAALVILYILFIVSLRLAKPADAEEGDAVPGAIIWIALCFGAVVAATYVVNSYLLVYTDGWHHISVTREILDRGIPPMAPFLPDIPLRYMWFYHLFGAVVTELTGLPVRVALGVFNAVNAFVFAYLIARLVSRFTAQRRYILSAPLFAFAGLESAGWVLFWPILIVRSLVGEVRGIEEIRRILGTVEINGTDVIWFLAPPGTWPMNLLDKFLTPTALNHSLNLFVLCFILVLTKDLLRESKIKSGIFILLSIIGSFLFHVVTGTTLVLTVIGAGILLSIIERWREREEPPAAQTRAAPLLAVLAALIVMPYFLSLTRGGGGGSMLRDHLHIGLRNVATILAPLIALIPFSIHTLRKILTGRSPQFRSLAAWLCVLFVLSIFIDLPALAENKLVFPLFLLLVPFVSWVIVDAVTGTRGIRRALIVSWVTVLFLVPPVLTVRGFMLERPQTRRDEKRYEITKGEREIFEWIEENTDVSAVVLERNTYHLMPVYARRRNFFLPEDYIRVHNYGGEKVERYRSIRDEVFSPRPLAAETRNMIRGLGFDLYIVIWNYDVEDTPELAEKFSLQHDYLKKPFENEAGAVYMVK